MVVEGLATGQRPAPASRLTGKVYWRGRLVDPQELLQVRKILQYVYRLVDPQEPLQVSYVLQYTYRLMYRSTGATAGEIDAAVYRLVDPQELLQVRKMLQYIDL